MEEKERSFIPGPGTLLLAIVLLSALGGIWRDANGVRFGSVGVIIWGGATLASFVLGTAYLSRRLLPIEGERGWSEGFRLLWHNYLLQFDNLLFRRQKVGPPTRKANKKKKSAANDLPPSFATLKAGVLPSRQAAIVARRQRGNHAEGPGLIILRKGEQILQVFDLRPQIRQLTTGATTRDGILLDVAMTITFQTRHRAASASGDRNEPDDLPYPYDGAALMMMAKSASIVDGEKRPWTERVTAQATALLSARIGRYTLDQLIAGGSRRPLDEIATNIKSELEQPWADGLQNPASGLEILDVTVAPLELPAEIINRRTATWQINWQNRISQEIVIGDIEARTTYQRARAQAQVENIERLLLNIEAMRGQGGAELQEIILLRLMEVVKAISADRVPRVDAPNSTYRELAAEASRELESVLGSVGGEN